MSTAEDQPDSGRGEAVRSEEKAMRLTVKSRAEHYNRQALSRETGSDLPKPTTGAGVGETPGKENNKKITEDA